MRYFGILILFIFPLLGQAQEFNAQVQIQLNQDVQLVDQRVIRELETSITRFLNDRRWTDDPYDALEKIDLNVQLTISEIPSIGNYAGTLILQAARPVYNASYTTVTFTFVDRDFNFSYNESQPLDYNENVFTSNLPMMLGFYANIVLGMDYDSFGLMGGTPFFEKARTIAQLAQQSNSAGWDPTSGGNAGRNRAALVENLFNPRMQAIREASYTYHRLALDNFIEDPDEGRRLVLEQLQKIKEVRDYNPSAILLITFFNAKDKELAAMFSEGDIAVRRKAYELLSRMDPSNDETYRTIIQQ